MEGDFEDDFGADFGVKEVSTDSPQGDFEDDFGADFGVKGVSTDSPQGDFEDDFGADFGVEEREIRARAAEKRLSKQRGERKKEQVDLAILKAKAAVAAVGREEKARRIREALENADKRARWRYDDTMQMRKISELGGADEGRPIHIIFKEEYSQHQPEVFNDKKAAKNYCELYFNLVWSDDGTKVGISSDRPWLKGESSWLYVHRGGEDVRGGGGRRRSKRRTRKRKSKKRKSHKRKRLKSKNKN